MDQQGHYDPEIVPMLFELGVMAIETPEELGGAGGSFFLSVLAVEEHSRVDAAVGVLVDVQNTLVTNAVLRFAARGAAEARAAQAGGRDGGRVRALRGGRGKRRVRVCRRAPSRTAITSC